MNTISTYTNYNNVAFKKAPQKFFGKASVPYTPTVLTEKAHNKINPFKTLQAIALGLTAILASTCSNIKGGNFIYNEQQERIERIADFKEEYEINEPEEACTTNQFNLHGCYDKQYINSVGIDNWIAQNQDKLVGSCIFDRKKDFVSKLIEVNTLASDCDNKFVPAHAAPIYRDEDGIFKVLQIESPYVYSINLKDYLMNPKKETVIYLRDFDINEERFTKNVKKYLGLPYSFADAAQSISGLITFDYGIFCSKGYTEAIQKEGKFKNINAGDITPHTLIHLLTNNHCNDLIKE